MRAPREIVLGGGEEKKQDGDYEEINQLLSIGRATPSPPPFESVTKLDLFQCNLSSLPASMSTLLPNLSILFCMKNKFTEMPSVIGDCENLQMVSFKSNKLSSIHPEALAPQLRWLILTDNALTEVPSTIGRCSNLQKLMLSGNKIKSLPDEIEMCQNLELVRLASNELSKPPMSLLRLPNLAWVALSDNPFLNHHGHSMYEDVSKLKVLSDESLDDSNIGEVLGTGASGITHKKTLNGVHVAVKMYSGKITSDGNPEEEKRISLLASTLGCECLIDVLGETANGSLVMELLTNVVAFADPPSLDSCSRDVYKPEAFLNPDEAVKMVSGLLDVLSKLHSSGVCHGDFYGHNILVKSDGTFSVKLTDFGAAFLYDRSSEYGKLIEKVEIRAFRHLVDEIRVLVQKNQPEVTKSAPVHQLLNELLDISLLAAAGTSFSQLQEEWIEKLSNMG